MSANNGSGPDGRPDVGPGRPPEAVFAMLWDALANLIGTAATATLVRRAAQRAVLRCPELGELIIVRTELDYTYTPPPAWKEGQGAATPALRELSTELQTLLIDSTGPIAVKHLERIPELRPLGFVSVRREPS